MKPLTILAWDTATQICAAGLMRVEDSEVEVLAEYQAEGNLHTRVLPPQIDGMLKKANLVMADIDLLAAGRGPGSFTGLRTGLALAKGLAMGTGKPLIGLSTLEILAAQILFDHRAAEEGFIAAPLVDARHNEIFTGLYEAAPETENPLGMRCLWEPQPVEPAAFAARLAEKVPDRKIMTAGPALNLTRASAPWPETIISGPEDLAPSARRLAILAAKIFINNAGGSHPALPLYIRQPDIRQTGIVML